MKKKICWCTIIDRVGLFYYGSPKPWNMKHGVTQYFLFTVDMFISHLSWKLNWTFLIACCPSSVPLYVWPSVCKLSTFSLRGDIIEIVKIRSRTWKRLLLKNRNETWHKGDLVDGDSCLFEWRVRPFPRAHNNEITKIHWKTLKILFSGITGLI